MSMTQTYPQLVESLNTLRRQWRMYKVLEGVLLALAGTAGVLVLLIAADNILQLEPAGRLVLSVVLWGTLLVSLSGLVVRRVLEDRRDDFFAALVEQKHPELRNQLINALQLGRGNINGFSPRLIEAIVDDAARATADLEMTESADGRPLKRAALAALAVAICIGLYASLPWLAPRFWNGLARVLLPIADIPAYTATRIGDIHPGNTQVPEGETVSIKAKVFGEIPAEAKLMRLGEEEREMVARVETEGEESFFRFDVLQPGTSFDYFVKAGDGRSKKYHVEVVKRPQVASLTLTYQHPGYTEKPERRQEQADGEIAALLGTRVTMELKSTKPLKEASLLTEKGDALALEQTGDAQSWKTSFVLWAKDVPPAADVAGQLLHGPTRYQLKMQSTEGYENADPLWRSIALGRDQAPSVVISMSGRDGRAQPDGTVSLTVVAKDDFGLADVKLQYRINDDATVHDLKAFSKAGSPPPLEARDTFDWNLSSLKLKDGDILHCWAIARDRNALTGPGQTASNQLSIFLERPESAVAKLNSTVIDYAKKLEEILRMQRENRAETSSGIVFAKLIERQVAIRKDTRDLARAMEKDSVPVHTIVKALDDLHAGPMADVVRLLEQGRDAGNPDKAGVHRAESLPVQDRIIKELEALLARLQRNEQAKKELRKLEKKDKAEHQKVVKTLDDLLKDLKDMLKDQTQLAGNLEKLPKKPTDELKEQTLKPAKDLDEFKKKWEAWTKGKVNELTKMPEGFIKDFDMRPDINKVYEEIEKATQRSKAEKMEISLEDLGAGLATKMKEDLEMWMADSPDATKWVFEEPLDQKGMKIPEMPLPKALEDLVGDLLQKADEFDKDADDVTSAWGDNLDQAGWGVADGPISTFSAKGKTGNDLPNNNEMQGRSGDGRRGKSSGQMVGDTTRGLQGRKTPARASNEKYEPGQLKQKNMDDPMGATGGGKVSGGGKRGLQGGTPPPIDLKRDFGRLSAKQAGVREKAEQVAKKLDSVGVNTKRLTESIELMKQAEQDLKDLRYEDAARKRKIALSKLHGAFDNVDPATAAKLSKSRDLPPHLRKELLQSADEGYPAGYENLLKSYFKALSTAEK
jgi:hypothetical protein